MTIVSFISSIKNRIPEANWPWVFAALTFDPLVWEALGGDHGQRLLEGPARLAEDFSPAALALMALNLDATPEELRQTPMTEINPGAEETSLPFVLAARTALFLRESRRGTSNWEAALQIKGRISPTALACLYGMVPDPAELIHAAYSLDIEATHHPGANPAIHALLANPMQPAAHVEVLNELLADLPRGERLTLISELHRYRPDLTPPLALATLNREPPLAINPDRLIGLGQIEKLLRAARLQRLADDLSQAFTSLTNASQAARRLQAELAAQIAQINSEKGDPQSAISAWEQAVSLDPASADHLASLLLAMIDNGQRDEALSRLEQSAFPTPHPAMSLASARLAFGSGNTDKAIQEARLALKMSEAAQSDSILLHPALTNTDLTGMFIQLDAAQDAVQSAELALNQKPNDPALLSLLARARLGIRQPIKAVQAAHLAAALLPQDLELRRLLAECLEMSGEWQAALQERTALLERTESPSQADLRNLAACALYAGHGAQSAQLSQQLVKQDENDGLAWMILGQAQATIGDDPEAVENLRRATQIASQDSAPWLALSRYYQVIKQPDKALETLQAASLAAPDLPDIYLALGEAYLTQGAPTQAMAVLRTAASLVKEQGKEGFVFKPWSPTDQIISLVRSLPDQISLRLGQTLHQLGHLDEAHRILEVPYLDSPEDIELARAYSQVLLAQKDLRAALDPLKAVLQSKPDDIVPYLEYARCSLTLHKQGHPQASLQETIQVIRNAQELAQKEPETTALLAEALALNDDLMPAMAAYKQALETDLGNDPDWLARLSLGLGEVAQKLGQIETAIAALHEASQADPADAHIQRSLSEAYDAAGLGEEAYQTAKAALLLAPGDVENLDWFATQIFNLKDRPGLSVPNAQVDAIDALERASRLAPERGDLWVKLGKALLQAGDEKTALEALNNVATTDGPAANSSPSDLYQAAQALVRLNEHASAAQCLERALQYGSSSDMPSSPSLLELLTSLSSAHSLAGDLPSALQAIDQAIALDPQEAALHLEKANMLLEMGHSSDNLPEAQSSKNEALASLVTALHLNPREPDLHRRAALILREAGDLPTALDHADQMVELSMTVSQSMEARALAADISFALLQPARARNYLAGTLPPSEPTQPIADSAALEYHSLRAETALDAGDDRGAIEELVRVLEIFPDEPRLLAIHSRIMHHREDPQAAQDVLENVIRSIGDPNNARIDLIRSVARAALELSQWEVACQLYEQAIRLAPFEARSHLDLGKTIVLRAEFSKLCLGLDAIQHAAEPVVFSEETRRAYELALIKAEELVKRWEAGRADQSKSEGTTNQQSNHWAEAMAQIHRWRVRGLAVFEPSAETNQALAALPPHPDDAAARVACLRILGDLNGAGLAARDFPQNPLVLLQLSLALINEKPRQAMAAIHAAVDVLGDPASTRRYGSAFCAHEITPLAHTLMARLFQTNGNRAGDRESALQAITTALSYWQDEPRWHALAAEIYLSGDLTEDPDDLESAITHLEHAIKLEPANRASLMILGQIYMRGGLASKAAQVFEQAAETDADEPDAWLWLARAHRTMGDLEQAATHAERAVTLAPNQVQPLLLRGEIALQDNNPRGAQSRAQAALRIQPDDPESLLLLARALNALDRPEEALATLEKALPLAAEPLPLSLERVRLLRRAHGPEAALQAAQTLADYSPDEPRVLALQAELLESSGQIEAAIRAAQRALRLPDRGASTSMPNSDLAKMHFLLGRLLRRTGQLDQAVHHLSETIRLAPDFIEAYLEIGHVHQERREHNQALNAFRQAITVAPHDHRAYYLISLALKESKDYLSAEKMLRRAADLAPNDVSIHRLLGAVVALNLVHNRRETARDTSQFL
jgi:tetratricopeptide (TPR) repeat protein